MLGCQHEETARSELSLSLSRAGPSTLRRVEEQCLCSAIPPAPCLSLLPVAMGTGSLTGTCLPPGRRLGNVGHPGRVLSLSISASGQYPDTSHFCSTELSPWGGDFSGAPAIHAVTVGALLGTSWYTCCWLETTQALGLPALIGVF